MKSLSNEALIDSYLKAIDLKLDRDFISLLLAEIKRRKLNVLYYTQDAQAN
ncbi:sporulation histidine kinase inhibitor Sda [Paenibacillus sp. HJGM_3]|uniref:sporulation histidine kinase inhibitor Sda n=1 Tax=Paenibacillus sp. HJGM_3 TaxID=3379816 RepID=UPI00385BF31B